MNPTIRVDDEVYAQLQAKAQPFTDTPNTVLRRLLGLDGSTHVASGPVPSAAGRTAAGKFVRLFAAGLLAPGDELFWERRNNRQRFTARLDEAGAFHLEDGSVHDSPSGAARHLSGYEVSGWRVWRRSSDGLSLDDLIAQLPPAEPGLQLPRRPAERREPGITRGALRRQIIAQLRGFGGSADRAAVLAGVQSALGDRLGPADVGQGSKGEPRWMERATEEYRRLQREGLASGPANSRVWRLTKQAVAPNRRGRHSQGPA